VQSQLLRIATSVEQLTDRLDHLPPSVALRTRVCRLSKRKQKALGLKEGANNSTWEQLETGRAHRKVQNNILAGSLGRPKSSVTETKKVGRHEGLTAARSRS
jgi:hypothetical protein